MTWKYCLHYSFYLLVDLRGLNGILNSMGPEIVLLIYILEHFLMYAIGSCERDLKEWLKDVVQNFIFFFVGWGALFLYFFLLQSLIFFVMRYMCPGIFNFFTLNNFYLCLLLNWNPVTNLWMRIRTFQSFLFVFLAKLKEKRDLFFQIRDM